MCKWINGLHSVSTRIDGERQYYTFWDIIEHKETRGKMMHLAY